LIQENNEVPQLLPDLPVDELLFGFDIYASTLASAIMATEPHFTLGIFGGWGCGKTTLLKGIEATLNSAYADRALTMFFDAWRYQREEHMLLPLLDMLSNRLEREQGYWQTPGRNLKRLTKAFVGALTLNTP